MDGTLNLMLCGLLAVGACARAQEAREESAKNGLGIRHVTLYRDRALVTREIAVPAGEPVRSIIVPDLPSTIMPDSVYADGVEGTVVRSVRVSRRSAARQSNDELQRLHEQSVELTRKQAEIQHESELVSENIKTLDQMIDFSAAASKSDLDRGVLDADSLTKLTTFAMTQRRELENERFRYGIQLQELAENLREIQSKRSKATSGRGETSYEARISLETQEGVAGIVRLSYQVDGCGWAPQYTVHGDSQRNSVTIRYSALAHQATAEDWTNVNLVLSTASPSVSAVRPLLTALEVSTIAPSSDNVGSDPFGAAAARKMPSLGQGDSLAEMLQSLRTQQQRAEEVLNEGQASVSSKRRDVALNSLAGQLQQIELQAEAQSWRNVAPDVRNNVASQVYTFPQAVSLESQPAQQVIQILEFELTGEMYHVATPLLSTFAYREAQVTNTQSVGLLGGPATIYLDDRFVGRVQIPSTASGQRITIGFGADQQVRTRRELTDKREVIKGGNRQLVFGVRLVVANFKDTPVAVRLMDRMPHTRQTQQLAVKLEDPPTPLSDDALYQRVLQPTGILRWDLTVPAGQHGSNAFDVDYNYTMEFDRSRLPTTEHSLAELQAQYENMLMPSGMGGFGGMGGMGGAQ